MDKVLENTKIMPNIYCDLAIKFVWCNNDLMVQFYTSKHLRISRLNLQAVLVKLYHWKQDF